MVEVKQVKNLIERDWQVSHSGRATDVPDPDENQITWTLEKEKRNARLKHQDVGYVASGADANYTPQGLGWTHTDLDSAVVIEYRARTRQVDGSYNNGHDRLFGKPTGPDGVQAADPYDGIANETKRIVDANHTRTGGWTLFGTNTAGEGVQIRDLSDLGGVNYYRGDVWIPMEAIAQELNP